MSYLQANRLARICAYSTKAPEWEELVRILSPVIELAAYRAARLWGEGNKNTVLEIVQEVFIKVCEDERRILREFEDRGDDSLLKLIRTITISVTTDYFRRNRAEKRGGLAEAVPVEIPGPASDAIDPNATRAVEWPMLLEQLDGLLKLLAGKISERDRSIFWLYYRQGLTADAISRIPSIELSLKGVESALLRITKLLRETVQNGKPKREIPKERVILQKNSEKVDSVKGFSTVVSIDSVNRR